MFLVSIQRCCILIRLYVNKELIMNSLDYIDSVFKIALEQYQNKDEVSVVDSQSILLSVHDKIKK